MAKDIRDVVKAAREQGFRVERTKSGHWVFYSPDVTKGPVYHSGTPGDRRAIDNLLAELRRAGLLWPPKGKKG
jgi:predicted RNA binding protein YcfA (HicA-like mRNA interferase family)